MNNIFQYIAESDPYGARTICSKYGYALQDADSVEGIGVCLEQLVSAEGEPAFRDILDMHPDKDVILEAFGSPAATPEKTSCGCKGKDHKHSKSLLASVQGTQINQSHVFIFAGALLLAAAIISKN